MINNLNIAAFFALVIYPILLISLAISYCLNYGIGTFEIILVIASYYICNISVGVGLHRLWSHSTYKTNKYVEFVLALFSAGTLQGPALSWASNHFNHHTHTDTEKDPHTPLKYKNRFLGFVWSHIGWMLIGEGSYKSIDKVTLVKLGNNKILRWQLKHYWFLAVLMNIVLPLLIGYVAGNQTLWSAYTGFLFIGIGRALQQQMTFCVNSACHFLGTQKYVKSTAGDIWWMAIFLLGENWHNFHHAFPSDYRNGSKWYQADVHKWIIYCMSKLGLAWDLNVTTAKRIEAKVSITLEQYANEKKGELEEANKKLTTLATTIQLILDEIDNSAAHKNLKKSYRKIQNNLNLLGQQINQQMLDLNSSSDKMIHIIMSKLHRYEDNIMNLKSKLLT